MVPGENGSAGDSPYLDPELVRTYERTALAISFAAPARELVEELRIAPGSRVLDVGSGTGAVAAPAAAAAGRRGLVVALEPSSEMRRLLAEKRIACVVGGRVPGLPFRDGCFDAVLAGFVLSHAHDPEAALADMTRVLRPGARLGLTAWGPNQSAYPLAWQEIAGRFASPGRLREAVRAVIPWDEAFQDPAHLQGIFDGAGLEQVGVRRRGHTVRTSVHDYLAVREASVEGKCLRRMVEASHWLRLQQELRTEFESRWGDRVEYTRDVFYVSGVKPSRRREP
jgi:ubiquinone/menaquinone biosynthesis C-methylase UbiE